MTDPFKTIEMLARERNEMLASQTRTQERIARYVEVARCAKAVVEAHEAYVGGDGDEGNDHEVLMACEAALTAAVQALEMGPEGASMQTPPAASGQQKALIRIRDASSSELECDASEWAAEALAGRELHLTNAEKRARGLPLKTPPAVVPYTPNRDIHEQPAGVVSYGGAGVVGFSGTHYGYPDCPMSKGLPSAEWFGNCTCPPKENA